MDPKGWNITQLKEWLSRPLTQEDDSFDFKEMIPEDEEGKYRLKKEFCGYANRSGGLFFFGIKNDKTLVGINEADQEFTTKLSQIVTTHIFPPSIKWTPYEHIPLEEKGKCIYIVKVFESIFSNKPHVVYMQNKGLSIPLRELGNLRLITDGAEIRRIFLNVDGYYPEYNIHVVEILKRVKIQQAPEFNLNERFILQVFKSYLRSSDNKDSQNAQIVSAIENIESQVSHIRSLLEGRSDGNTADVTTPNQTLGKMVDDFITNWGKNIL